MRTFSIAITSFLFATTLFASKAAETPPATQKACFKIEGMVCHGCEQTIQGEALKIKGVKSFVASFKKKNATATFDPKEAGPDLAKKIKAAVDTAGYTCVETTCS
jgi:copper chaperone CopZ